MEQTIIMKNKTTPMRVATDLFMDGFKMNLSPDAVDPNKYLKNVKTPTTVYQDLPSSLFFNPSISTTTISGD